VSATPDLRQRTGQSQRQQLCAACSPRPTFRPRSAAPGQVVIQASGVGTAAAVEAYAPTLFCQAACAHVHTGLLLADHAPQYARCARRPLPRNGSLSFAIFFPCRQAAAFLARQQDRSARHPSLTLRAKRCGSVVEALKDRH
jgi:hypothetical protein